MIDLSGYSLADMRNLQEKIAKEIKTRQGQELENARAQIEEIARSVGMPLAELFSKAAKSGSKSNSAKVAARYRHPNDEKKAWTGRGRQPKWVVEWLESGKSLKDLEIARPT